VQASVRGGTIVPIKKRLLTYLSTIPGEPVTLKELSRHLKARGREDFQELRESIDELLKAGILDKDDRGRISYLPQKKRRQRPHQLVGRLFVTRRG